MPRRLGGSLARLALPVRARDGAGRCRVTPQEFLDEFGTLAESAEGVPKLREFVIDLGTQRMLVPRDGNAKEEIAPRPLGDFIKLRTGKLDANAQDEDGKYPFFTCSRDPLRINRFVYDCECVLLGGNGDFNVNYYNGKFEAYQRTYILESADKERLSVRFLYWHMIRYSWILREQSIGGVIRYIRKAHLTDAPIVVPPLAEQHRIVSKVDELLGLCDRLEAVQGERRGVRVRLNRSSLDRLTSSSTARGSGLSAAWQRVCDHFEVLYDTPETLPDLRQTILQLAVQGKLVPQDPNDEPAEELLERINAERNQLIADKVLKKSKPLPALTEDEFPIEPSPPGWQFERMGNLFRFIDYRGKTPTKVPSGVRLITAKNVRMGFLKDAPREFVTEQTYADWMTRGFPADGDLLFTTEAPMGNICQIPSELVEERFALAQRTINFHPYADQHSPFLMYSIMSRT